MAESLPRPSDKWIPWYIVAFFVLLVSTIVPMGILAVRTNTGVITDNAYEKGLAYNHDLAASAQQEQLGWHTDLNATRSSDGQTDITARATDGTGAAIKDATVNLLIQRPTQSGMDQ